MVDYIISDDTECLHSRIGNGSAVNPVDMSHKIKNPNSYYYGKDVIMLRHTSYIIPKGSPLQVYLIIT